MSGSTIGGVVGGLVGFFASGFNPAGAQWGWMIGSAIGGYVDPEVIKNQGPRLSDATSQTARDGVPITFGYGTFPTAGNIIWRAPLVENVITNRERQGKGGGPVVETTTYQYTRSFAIGICEGPITGLLIVKQNGAIVYDARTDAELTAVGYDAAMISATRAGSASWMRNKVLYLGDETQVADSVMEAHEGVGNVPAYRGLAYLRIENEDLTDLRGAVPQYEFVVCANGTEGQAVDEPDLFAWWPLNDTDDGLGGVATELVSGRNGTYSDLSSIAAGPELVAGGGPSMWLNATSDYMVVDSEPTQTFDTDNLLGWSISAWCQPTSTSGGSVFKNVFTNWANATNGTTQWNLRLDSTNNMVPSGGSTHDNFGNVTSLNSGVQATAGQTYYLVLTFEDDGSGVGTGTHRLYVNGALVATKVGDHGTALNGNQIAVGGYAFPSSYGFIGYVQHVKFYKRTLTPSQVAGYYAPSSGGSGLTPLPDVPGGYVDPDGNLVGVSTSTISRTPVNVSDIITDICARRGIDASQIDVSDIDDTVVGFRVASEGGGDVHLAPLLVYSFADAGEWDGKLRFVKRGGSSLYTITADDLIEREGDAIDQTRVQEAELLRKNTVTYIDPLATYTPTTQTWERRAGTVDAKGEGSIELAIVSDGTTMAQVTEKRGKVAWSETEKYAFGLPLPRFAKVTPTDVVTLVDKKGVSHRIRLMKTEEDSGALLIEDAAKDRQPAYIGTVSAAAPTTTPGQTPPPARGPTVFRAANLPYLRESDTSPGIVVWGTGLLPGWVGFDLYISADEGDSFQYAGRYLNRATIGWLTGDITSSTEPVPVKLYDNRTLETLTDAQIAARQGFAAIITAGMAEIVQYQTVSGTNPYDLTDVSRGENSTVATSHSEDDTFALLDQAAYQIPIPMEYAGRTLTLWPVSLGTAAADNETTTLVYDPPEYILDGNGEDDPGEDGPTPPSGGASNPGTPTSRTVGSGGTVSPSLTAGEANAAANSSAVNTASSGGNKIVTLPAGTYYIDTSDPIIVRSGMRLDLSAGTVLRAAGSNTTTAPSTHRDIIKVDGANQWEIKGGSGAELIGYRDYWAANGGVSAFGVSEWGHGIYVTNSSTNGTIYNLTFSKFIGDGISVGRSTSNLHILNCLSTNNRRQGFSVAGISASANIHLENCEASYIGIGDGTSPKAGVDCEVDEPATNSTSGITLTNLYTHHNAGPGVICYKSVNNITITGLRSEFNTKGIYAVDSDNVDVDGDIKWNKYEGIHLTGTCTNWNLDGIDFFSNKTKQYGTFTTGATTSSPTTTQKAKHITIGSSVTGTTYGTNTYGPV